MRYTVSFPGAKRPERDFESSHPTIGEVIPLWVFVADYRVTFKPVPLILNTEVVIKELTDKLSLSFSVNKISMQLTPY
jgi:hypothetical protein